MAGRELTGNQSATLLAIAAYISLHGYPPTRIELAVVLGVSPSAVEDRLAALEAKGAIRRTPGLARAIQIITNDEGE